MNPRSTIAQIVDEHFIHASVLYHFGIPFFDVPTDTLESVCVSYGVEKEVIIRAMQEAARETRVQTHREFSQYPVDLIIAYLQHAHQVFIKKRLSYMGKLICHLDPSWGVSQTLVDDLQFVYPLFAEDFIHHIYLEEDTLFSYIRSLQEAHTGKINPRVFHLMEQHSIQDFSVEHLVEDDEMLGIREITEGYTLEADKSQLLRVVYGELRTFEEELIVHAKVENEVLFPKALMLEQAVKKRLQHTIRFN